MSGHRLALPCSCSNCVDSRSFNIPQSPWGLNWISFVLVGVFAILIFLCAGVEFINQVDFHMFAFSTVFAVGMVVGLGFFIRSVYRYLRGRRVWVYRDSDGNFHTHLPHQVSHDKVRLIMEVVIGRKGDGTRLLSGTGHEWYGFGYNDLKELYSIVSVDESGEVTLSVEIRKKYIKVDLRADIMKVYKMIADKWTLGEKIMGMPSDRAQQHLAYLEKIDGNWGTIMGHLLRHEDGVSLERMLWDLCEIEYIAVQNAAAGKSTHVRAVRSAVEAMVGVFFRPSDIGAMRKRVANEHEEERQMFGEHVDKCGNTKCRINGGAAVMRRSFGGPMRYQCPYCGFERTYDAAEEQLREGGMRTAV